jgi:hypothetical protein
MEADAGGQDAVGASRGSELLWVDELGQRREDDVVELSHGAGQAGAVECGTAVPVSGGDSETGDPECAECECSGCCECAGCSAGSEEPGAAVSVSGRAAGRVVFLLFVLFEFG